MNLGIHSNNIVSLKKGNLILSVAVVILSLIIAMLAITLTSKHERIVVVPPGLSGPVKIDWGHADAEYIKTFGMFYATLIGTVSPKNIEYVVDRLSSMTTVSSYPIIRKRLLSLSKDPSFSTSGSSVNFVSNKIEYEPERGKVFVIGENRTQSGYGEAAVTPVVYELDIRMIEGRPMVTVLENYPGTQPHTKQWLEQHANDKKEVAQ